MKEVKLKRVIIEYNDGSEIFFVDKDQAEVFFEAFRSRPSISKKDSYVQLKDQIIFLDNIKRIKFNLED